MDYQEDPLVMKIIHLYEEISKLDSLKPSQNVDMLFGELVATCIPPNPIDVTKLSCKTLQDIRSKLIRLCGEAEGYLESHYSSLLGSSPSSYQNPLHHLHIFPYLSNYLKLTRLEYDILFQHLSNHHHDSISPVPPSKIAFLGSGPLPLTSILLATNHLPNTVFHNYDMDPSANAMASRLISSDPDISRRMFFHTADVMNVTSELREYNVVFLAALVGMEKEEKVRIIDHVGEYMEAGAILMLRSAHGARGFLYPIVDPCDDLKGFEVLSVYHPSDDVINSVVIARKVMKNGGEACEVEGEVGTAAGCMLMPCNCSKMHIALHGKTIMENQHLF